MRARLLPFILGLGFWGCDAPAENVQAFVKTDEIKDIGIHPDIVSGDVSRDAGAGPFPENASPALTGEIALGRLHFARYTRGDAVEKSCALNTMTHEIGHTLSAAG